MQVHVTRALKLKKLRGRATHRMKKNIINFKSEM
jgi:hypothetical protein